MSRSGEHPRTHRGRLGYSWRPHSTLTPTEWRSIASRTVLGFMRQRGIDSAAALTYFGCLALLPVSLTIVSALALVSGDAEADHTLLAVVGAVAQPATVDALRGPLHQLGTIPVPGAALAIGLALTLWTVASYAACFGRTLNSFYEVQEGRPLLKFRSTMVLLAVPLIVGGAIVVAIVLSTPAILTPIGHSMHIGEPWLTLWRFVKWPLLVLVFACMLGALYYWTPNVQRQTVSPISWGALAAIFGWGLASAGFAVYVVNIGHYHRVYGSLGGAVVLLVWLYITNLVLVSGASLDTEVVRMHQLRDGLESEVTITVPLRDSNRNLRLARRLADAQATGREIRRASDAEHAARVRHKLPVQEVFFSSLRGREETRRSVGCMTSASDPSIDSASRPDGTPTERQVEQDFTTPADADVSPTPIDHDAADDKAGGQ